MLVVEGTLLVGLLVLVDILGDAEILDGDVLLGDSTLLTKVLLAKGRINPDEATAADDSLDDDTLLIDVGGTDNTLLTKVLFAEGRINAEEAMTADDKLDDDTLLIDVVETELAVAVNIGEVLDIEMLLSDNVLLVDVLSTDDNRVLLADTLLDGGKLFGRVPSTEDKLRAPEVVTNELFGNEALLVREAPVAGWDVEAVGKLSPLVAIFPELTAESTLPSSHSHSPVSSWVTARGKHRKPKNKVHAKTFMFTETLDPHDVKMMATSIVVA